MFKLRLSFVRPVEQKPIDIYGNIYMFGLCWNMETHTSICVCLCVYVYIYSFIYLHTHLYISKVYEKRTIFLPIVENCSTTHFKICTKSFSVQ